MKKMIASIFMFCLFTSMVAANTISLSIITKMNPSEESTLEDAKRIVTEINAGKNSIAISDATLECPEDNNPDYSVKWFQILKYWVPQDKKLDVRYSAQISYELECNQ